MPTLFGTIEDVTGAPLDPAALPRVTVRAPSQRASLAEQARLVASVPVPVTVTAAGEITVDLEPGPAILLVETNRSRDVYELGVTEDMTLLTEALAETLPERSWVESLMVKLREDTVTAATDALEAAIATGQDRAEIEQLRQNLIDAANQNAAPHLTQAALNATYETQVQATSKLIVAPSSMTGPNVLVGGTQNNTAIASDVGISVILQPGTGPYNNVIGGDGANVNTTTPNTTTTGTNAHVSVVGGYDNSAGALSSKIISDHSKTLPGSGGHNGIFGGANITMGSNASFAFSTGRRNTVNALAAGVVGTDNTSTGNLSWTSGGFNTNNSIQGVMSGQNGTNIAAYGWVHGNYCQTVSGANHASAMGFYAMGRNPAQNALASQRIATTGDCQTSVTHFGGTTTSDVETTLRSGPVAAVTVWALARGQAATVDLTVIGKEIATGHVIGAWDIKAVVEWPATGNLVVLQAPVVTPRFVRTEDPAIAPTATLVTASTAGAVAPRVKGMTGRPVAWSARMVTVEIAT
ncbi:hypothetical protein [Dietzia sp. ANT_WB102]|uniref:hypothetical protein n=1 Tax=Dietzia sp. ANT_WB102 TaxID=2597345 RepID=UPI00165DA77B|nr:hypothetical protein [Dietzia sp. ANT_WB102]